MRVRGFLFTFRCFSSELWVKAERVIWFACCRFKWGLELSPVEFLHRYKLKKSNTTAGCSKCVNICETEAKTPSRWTPFPSLCNPGQPKATCWLLNTHTRLLVHTHTHSQDWPLAQTHTNTVGMAKTDGQHSPSQPFVRCEFSTQAGELFMCVYVRNE